MNERTLALLKWMQQLDPLGITRNSVPPQDIPGISMSNVRGLERMGLIEEQVVGIWYLTDKGHNAQCDNIKSTKARN